MIWKEKKAQTSIEYLLLIGGVIAVATAVGLYLKQAAQTVGDRGESETEEILSK